MPRRTPEDKFRGGDFRGTLAGRGGVSLRKHERKLPRPPWSILTRPNAPVARWRIILGGCKCGNGDGGRNRGGDKRERRKKWELGLRAVR